MRKILVGFILMIPFYGQGQTMTVESITDSLTKYGVEEIEISRAIIIQETMWLRCTKCSMDGNNIFGFETANGYLRFNSITECILYYKRWQERKWKPYHEKYPDKSYYDFLRYVGYAADMDKYISNLRWIVNKMRSKGI